MLNAAIFHDFDHQGVNNDFLIKTRHNLAITYNDASPNEAHHIAATYHLLMSNPAFNFAPHLSIEEKNIIRATIIELVMATDMKRHFGLVSQFQVCFSHLLHPAMAEDSDSTAQVHTPSGMSPRHCLEECDKPEVSAALLMSYLITKQRYGLSLFVSCLVSSGFWPACWSVALLLRMGSGLLQKNLR